MKEPEQEQEQYTDYEGQKRRRMEDILGMATTQISEVATPGERLLPLLYAAMETCWIDAIIIGLAVLELFHTHTPLMPLWAPFVLIAGSLLLYNYLERRAATQASGEKVEEQSGMLPGTPFFVTVIALVVLFLIWISLYAQSWFLLDPRWLLSMVNDILLLNGQAYHVLTIVAVSIFLCWRGIRLAQRELQPTNIFRTLQLGMILIVGIILLQAIVASTGTAPDASNTVALLFLIPLFLFFSLSAHALARVIFVRHMHPGGLEGSPVVQEQAIITITAIIGAVLLILALIVNSFASPAFLAQTEQTFSWVGAVYSWLVNIIATALAFLATPIFWLFQWFTSLLPPNVQHITVPTSPVQAKGGSVKAPPTLPIAILIIAKILLPVLILAIIVLLLRLALRRRRVRLVRHRGQDETRESLWSWSLFWTQVKALFLALFRRFFPQKEQEGQAEQAEQLQGEPAARSIREIYRLLLLWAASRGLPRHRDETPYEFRQRLDERLSSTEPQLEGITEAYAATRYGGYVPNEAEVARVRQQWAELEQKTRILS